MKIKIKNLPFPNKKINPDVTKELRIKSQGVLLKDTKGEEIIVKGFNETDILEIREKLIDEVKRQNKEEEELI